MEKDVNLTWIKICDVEIMNTLNNDLFGISKAALVIPAKKFEAFSLKQMQLVEFFILGITGSKGPINVIDAILVQPHAKQCCRSATHIKYIIYFVCTIMPIK